VSVSYTPTGPPNYNSSSGSFTQTVGKATTSASLVVSPKKPSAGGPLTLTAVVLAGLPSSGTPTGNVSFQVMGKHTGPLLCDAPLVNNTAPVGTGTVTCNIASIPDGSAPLKVTATYFGDTNYTSASTKIKKVKLS
jgi:hypothetical protein